MSIIQNPAHVITRKMPIPGYNADISYPVVVGIGNADVEQRINAAIRSGVNALIESQLGQPPAQASYISTMQGWYEIKTNERGILSITLGNYTYAYHAAHGMTLLKSLTFNINDGTLYSLGSLFKPGSDYVKRLSDIVGAQIKARDIPILGDYKGIDPDQDFYIADRSLVLYYQLYALAPYAYGFPFFPISVYEIQGIIDESGPLGWVSMST